MRVTTCLIFLICYPEYAFSDEIYKFIRMWPVFEQPWYFSYPTGIAVDSNGYIYVANSKNGYIQKFTSDGQFVTKWGKEGSEDGAFDFLFDIAVDDMGFVYVTDMNNHRIQKFTSNGEFVKKWGKPGTGNGEFDRPHGISILNNNFAYVVDTRNHCVQVFNSEGNFIAKWGEKGSREGTFDSPEGITIDNNSGSVYVTDTNNHRIQKFEANGQFIIEWGKKGDKKGEFTNPDWITVDNNGFVYVTDKFNHRIQKFTSDGEFEGSWEREYKPDAMAPDKEFIYVTDKKSQCVYKFTSDGQFVARWGTSIDDGYFNSPKGITIDKNGYVYVADTNNNRIQKFSSDGENFVFVTKWGSEGTEDGDFDTPHGLTVDSQGFVYVADRFNHRIQKFTSDGEFVSKWGNKDGLFSIEKGEFDSPYDIELDNNGFIYVADSGNHRIQKFTSEGGFITQWGNKGEGNGEFTFPYGIATDSKNFVYVVDEKRVQKFTSDGIFDTKWIIEYSGNDEFCSPPGIAVDKEDSVYVADTCNHQIQKFTSKGQLITVLGEKGNDPGQMSYPGDIAIHPDGNVYITDTANQRIQLFKKIEPITSNNKAIIIAGGGDYQGNRLWDATQLCANFAYRTLIYQGFPKNAICYLSPDKDLDLDGNGKADDVYGKATNNNLQEAIAGCTGANKLILYLVDHGGRETFRMSDSENLYVSQLKTWLHELQTTMHGKIIIIYDACQSGSFLPALVGNKRIVIASTSPDENSHFISQGSISFSDFFWSHIFNSYDIEQSFKYATEAINEVTEHQNPLLDSNGDGLGNKSQDYDSVQGVYIGNRANIQENIPKIQEIFDNITVSDTNPATLYAVVTDNDGIAHVWAVIKPPDYTQNLWYSSNTPVLEIPSIDLMPIGNNRYEAVYEGFNIKGTYKVAVYARDRLGNTSLPKLSTVSVDKTLRRRAVIVAGNYSTDLGPAIKNAANLACRTLISQWYADDEIFIYSSEPSSKEIGTLKDLIENRASQDTLDIVIYLVGRGERGIFHISDTEKLLIDDLKTWLDTLQNKINGKVTVICDADYSGSFIEMLKPPEGKQRILISSTSPNQQALFSSQGHISFSSFFWKEILKGMNVRTAFLSAKNSIGLYSHVLPQLDDNGNGEGNESSDGQLAKDFTIGPGIKFEDNETVYQSTGPDIYEPDANPVLANPVVINSETPQHHNLWDHGDEDWMKFHGVSGVAYEIQVNSTGKHFHAEVEIRDSKGKSVEMRNTPLPPSWSWECEQDGLYYLKITSSNSVFSAYNLAIDNFIAPFPGYIKGIITDKDSGKPIKDAQIKTDRNASCLSLPNGRYLMIHEPGTFDITVRAFGYASVTEKKEDIKEAGTTVIDFKLLPSDNEPDTDPVSPNSISPMSHPSADDVEGAGCFINILVK